MPFKDLLDPKALADSEVFVDLLAAYLDAPVDVKMDMLTAALPERLRLLLERVEMEIAAEHSAAS